MLQRVHVARRCREAQVDHILLLVVAALLLRVVGVVELEVFFVRRVLRVDLGELERGVSLLGVIGPLLVGPQHARGLIKLEVRPGEVQHTRA